MSDRTVDPAAEVARLERRVARERAARRASERIAEDALRRMYETNELKTVLLATISHELRTPATVMQGLSSLLVSRWGEAAPATLHDLAKRLATNATALAELVERVLEFARLEQGAGDAAIVELDLRTWLPAVADELREASDDHVLVVMVDGNPSVTGVATALRQVLANFVSNAQRYAPAGTTITIHAAIDDGQLVIQVDDEGPGVTHEERGRIFEPFYRGPGDHVTRTSGFGIGLSVVRRMAHILGAQIEVADTPTGGARFGLRFPMS